ncbi:MAG: hypothetical protein JXR77_17375 [Lentisphaeria bacterium]|nr:hypothetical protein [Lentisphaeria bacterium]
MKVRLPGIIRNDPVRKVVALFFAVLIWLTVDTELRKSLVLRNVPVAVDYDPRVLVLEEPPQPVDVTVRGSRRRLENVTTADIEMVAQIPPDIHEGVYFYGIGLTPKNNVRRTPPGIRVTGISPNRIDVQIDRIVTRARVPVKVVFEGQLKEGYRVIRVQAKPESLMVKGRYRSVVGLTEIQTEPVLLDDTVVQDFLVTARLAPIAGVEAMGDVTVEVAISRQATPRTLHGLPLAILIDPGAGLQLGEPLPEATVIIRGPKALLEELSDLAVRPFVDLSGITSPGRYRRQVRIWMDAPKEVLADPPTPGWADVTLVAAPAKTGAPPTAVAPGSPPPP